jgi:uncharacterized protein (TIGR01777 family)
MFRDELSNKVNHMKSRRVVLAGGFGQVGRVLARHFHSLGDSVVVLTRKPIDEPCQCTKWDGVTIGPWIEALNNADLVINLAGRSVNCRYNSRNRREILESRLKSTEILGRAIQQVPHPPRLWLNASTATIYRHALDRPMDEFTGEIDIVQPNAPSTWNFSIEVATRWEGTFFKPDTPRTRKVAMRSAMVMSPDRGGIFDTLLALVRFGLGGSSGSGKQFVSWIHEADFVNAIEFLIGYEKMMGCVNLASPHPLPNAQFMRVIREAWGIDLGLPATDWTLEIGAIFLRTETELILKSRRVVPGRLLQSGFSFQFPEWPAAAKQLVDQWRGNSRRLAGSPYLNRVTR